jgi:hypothetical protein
MFLPVLVSMLLSMSVTVMMRMKGVEAMVKVNIPPLPAMMSMTMLMDGPSLHCHMGAAGWMTRTVVLEVPLDVISMLQVVVGLPRASLKGMTSLVTPPVQITITTKLKVCDFTGKYLVLQMPDPDFVHVIGRLQNDLTTRFPKST